MPTVRQTLEGPKKPSAGVAGLQHRTEKQPFSRGPSGQDGPLSARESSAPWARSMAVRGKRQCRVVRSYRASEKNFPTCYSRRLRGFA
jgi:hypothetical protein